MNKNAPAGNRTRVNSLGSYDSASKLLVLHTILAQPFLKTDLQVIVLTKTQKMIILTDKSQCQAGLS